MFDLDQALMAWRQQMNAAGLHDPEDLNELESHLREDVESRARSGLDERLAFEAAVQRMGQATSIRTEYAKADGALDSFGRRFQHALLTLAGVPDPCLATSINTPNMNSNPEPAWATYLKNAVFLAPALVLWFASLIFLVPKLREVTALVGQPLLLPTEVMLEFSRHAWLAVGGIVAALLVLEWRSNGWPRYRRAALGCAAFVLNTVVLISITLLLVTTLVNASALFHHVKQEPRISASAK